METLATIDQLLDMAAKRGGVIVSTGRLSVDAINSARETGRMYVRDDALGWVWLPQSQMDEYILKLDPVAEADIDGM